MNDFVTSLDINLQKHIIQRLKGNIHHTAISEEKELAYSQVDSDYVWIIDPLDGTVNFINNIGFMQFNLLNL